MEGYRRAEGAKAFLSQTAKIGTCSTVGCRGGPGIFVRMCGVRSNAHNSAQSRPF